MSRRVCAVDANQPEIVDELRKMGCLVHCTHQAGAGFPDLVVGFRGKLFLLEVKDGAKVPSAQKLTPDQEVFHAKWAGYVKVVNSIESAIGAVND